MLSDARRHRVSECHGLVRWKAVPLKFGCGPEVRLFDAPLAGRAGCPRKVFAEPRLPEKVLKPVEMAGAAICTNSVAEITCGVPHRGATRGIPLDGMRERRKRVGHMRGVPPDTAVAFERSGKTYYVSRSGPSRSRLKHPNDQTQLNAAGEGTINRREYLC